jgi:4-hydroxy-tetrahydrodipicolinate synthase
MFSGSIVALVTPFRNGELDETAFRKLIRFQIRNGTDGIVVGGCTGESANLSIDELTRLVRWAQEEIQRQDRKVVLLAGTGTNTTSGTIDRTAHAAGLGVDGVLLITPYYNKPSPEGLIAHYTRIAESVDIPIILYNVPGRTGVNMLPETITRLAEIKTIVAVKEASGNIDQVSALRTMSDITILSGDDTLTLPMLAAGARGVISVTANIDPRRVSEMCRTWFAGNPEAALKIHLDLFHLSKVLFVETNPMPVKAALELMEMISGELRLPLVSVKPQSREMIRNVLVQNGLLKD